jgi:transposase-like protein
MCLVNSKEKQSRRRDTAEFKEQAVKRVLSGHVVMAVVRELGVGDSLIHNGLARHRQQAGAGEVGW